MWTAGLRWIGGTTLGLAAEAGALWRLGAASVSRLMFKPVGGQRFRTRATILEICESGYRSLPLVSLICVLVGMIMALQAAYQLEQMGAIQLVPNLVGLSMTRELAPLLTAVVVAGRVGSAIAAALGTMRVSQEIDALTVMGIDPVSFLVVPRLVGLFIAVPCLTIFADVLGIVGGLIVAVSLLEMSMASYVALTFDALVLQNIFIGLAKALFFAALIGLVGSHQGLQTRGGAEEVGRATTRSVVHSIVLVILADLFVTALFFAKG